MERSVSDLKVSLVTPSYNMAPYLERTLRSVLCQDYSNIEYIVLDSCSNDGTQEILQRYASALDVLIVEKDRGQSDALHRGFRLAGGDILGYLNADDCLTSTHTISEVVRRFKDNPTADVIYGQRYFIDGEGEYLRRDPYRPFCGRAILFSDYIAQEATFWRRSIYEKAGRAIDLSFECAMDYELWLRMLAHGARFLAVPEVWGLFRNYPNQKSTAWWQSIVLPEVARLYDRYLGYRLSEPEMFDHHGRYLYGVYRHEEPELYDFYHRLWAGAHERTRAALRGKPLDRWMETAPLNMERIDRVRRARAGRKAG
jgi:glycosyltransferase involved in cell wall biosynthesis